MDRKRQEEILRRPEEERARDSFPPGFPPRIDVPAGRYVSEELLALERRYLFEACWLFVAHADELPNPGDFRLLDALDRLGHPLFLIRGEDGRIRAFYNACRHRGGPLVNEASGSAGRRLVCKYHAWSYDLDGRLAAIPEAKNFAAGAKETCPALAQVECETWGSFVFVKLTPGGPSLRQHLEPVASELDEIIGDGAAPTHFAGIRQLDVACNWKAPGDGNIETYHVPFVHARSAAPLLDEKRTGQWLLPQGHSRMLIRFRGEVPSLPLPRFSGDTALAEAGIYSFHVFPNLSVVFGGPSFAFFIATFPDGVDRCSYVTHFFSPAARGPENAGLLDAVIEANWRVLLEDLASQMAAQKAMRCGALDVLRLQYQERRIRYVHEEIDRRIGADRIAAHLRVPALLDAFVEKE